MLPRLSHTLSLSRLLLPTPLPQQTYRYYRFSATHRRHRTTLTAYNVVSPVSVSERVFVPLLWSLGSWSSLTPATSLEMAFPQSSTQAGDELATLFSRNMTFQQPQPLQQQPQLEPEPIKYSISQHYHHSAHTVHREDPTPEPQRAASVPPQTQPSAEQVLSQHGIDPLCLSPQQLDLFKTADTPQQIRLVELWQIYPPTHAQQTNPAVAWTNTTVEQEELLAQLRHEQKLAEEEARRNSIMSCTLFYVFHVYPFWHMSYLPACSSAPYAQVKS